ncbi:hypothetical protein JMJ56_28205 [Belnapia sp. T18]|uniref:Uncharacterized protein n=1 Tax=Belnapia arida TaxID=2804533 RepID=A0ABS1UB01_9PROT|nr:hypothetical protein [Belnapia arida]MBL6081873.1 hypothetical protein [Belnapia arida]
MARRRITEGRTEDVLRYLEASQKATERAAGLTRRLLAFARQQHLEAKPVDADRLIASLGDLVRRTMETSIGVELRPCGGTGSVMCDANELESAILNLCINARDVMPEGGRFMIGTEQMELSAADLQADQTLPGH